MENNLKNLLDGVDLKKYLPSGYCRQISDRIREANQELSEDTQIPSSQYSISRVINERRYYHPIFPFVMELIIEKREKDKGVRNKFLDHFDQFVSIINE